MHTNLPKYFSNLLQEESRVKLHHYGLPHVFTLQVVHISKDSLFNWSLFSCDLRTSISDLRALTCSNLPASSIRQFCKSQPYRKQLPQNQPNTSILGSAPSWEPWHSVLLILNLYLVPRLSHFQLWLPLPLLSTHDVTIYREHYI